MEERSLSALQAHRPALLLRWEELLRAAPVTSPLANPDTLVHLMAWTLDQIFRELTLGRHPARSHRPPCPCGLNPLLAYFATARTSLHETLAHGSGGAAAKTDADQLERAISIVADREIRTFCELCLRNEHRNRHEPVTRPRKPEAEVSIPARLAQDAP